MKAGVGLHIIRPCVLLAKCGTEPCDLDVGRTDEINVVGDNSDEAEDCDSAVGETMSYIL